MFKSILVVTLSLVLIGSILAPSVVLLLDLKTELLALEDFSKEGTEKGEQETYEKEIILQATQKDALLFLERNTKLNSFRQDYTLLYSLDIFLPPPEHI